MRTKLHEGNADGRAPGDFAGLASSALPPGAEWLDRGAGHLAVYPLTAVRGAPDQAEAILDFFEAAYRGGAALAGWDIDRYACSDGVTDPVRAAAEG